MPKPAKIDACGIQLVHEPGGVTFSTFVEVKRNHGIEDGAIVNIKKTGVCIGAKLYDYEWTSRPIDLGKDLQPGNKVNRFFLKLTMSLTIRDTNNPCEKTVISPPGPGFVTVTITNSPIMGTPETSDPEDADPIFFP